MRNAKLKSKISCRGAIYRALLLTILIAAISVFSDDDDNAIVLEDYEMEIEEIGDDDDLAFMPEVIGFVNAVYPEELADSSIGGVVSLQVIVSETGTVDSVAIINSLHPLLDSAAITAVKQFKFSPAKLADGTAVAVMLQYEYQFNPPGIADDDDINTDISTDTSANISTDTSANISIDSNISTDTGTNISTDTKDDDDDADDLSGDYSLTVYGKEEVKEVSRHRITISEVKRMPGFGNDAARVVQAMPGVGRPSFGGTEVIVRGAPGWDSRYFIDGVTVPLLYHMTNMTSIYPSDAIEAIDFYPGGFSTRYGGAVAGVIEMTSRKSKTDRIQGHVDLSMLNWALFLEGPINERVSFMASARRDFTGDVIRLFFSIVGPEFAGFSIAPFSWDYLLRTDVVLSDNHDLFVTMLGSRDSLGMFVPDINVGSSEIDDQTEQMGTLVTFHTLTAGLESKWSDSWKNSLRLSGTYARTLMSVFGMAKIEETPLVGHLRNQASYKASENLTVNIGADVELINENLILIINTGQNMIVRDTIDNWLFGIVGGYANFEWRPINRLLLIPGVRYDYFPELDYAGEPSFRVSGRYELTKEHTVKAAVGSYSQTPQPTGMVIHEVFGEPGLPATKAAQYIAGHEWQITDLISLDAQSYYNHTWDIPRFYNSRIDYDSTREMQRLYFSDGFSRTYGLEFMLRHAKSEKFFGWISYTLSRSEMWSKVDDKYILSSRDEPHHLQLLGSYSLNENWDIGAKARFVSGKPTSPIVGTIEDENDKTIRPVYGERNSTRHNPFFQLDFRVDYTKLYYNEKLKLTYYVDLQNILWPIYKSPEFTFYNYNYTEKQSISMIPLISTGLRVEF